MRLLSLTIVQSLTKEKKVRVHSDQEPKASLDKEFGEEDVEDKVDSKGSTKSIFKKMQKIGNFSPKLTCHFF